MTLRNLTGSALVLALFCTLGSLMAQDNPPASRCHAVPELTTKTLPWTGGLGEIGFTADTPECSAAAPSVTWLSVSVLPPGSGTATGPNGRTLKYSADVNMTPKPREVKINLGDADLTIMQEGGPRP